MSKKLVVICLLNFFIAALMGLTLRYFFINTIPINYRFLTHAHSHVAMLGWVYLMLFTLIVHYFVPNNKKAVFNNLFWLTEIAVVGMMVSFPISRICRGIHYVFYPSHFMQLLFCLSHLETSSN